MPRDRTKFTKARPPAAEAVDTPWRLFTAISIEPPHQEYIERILELARATELPIRWISASAAHLTLQFIGEVPPERGELLRMAFPAAAKGALPLSLSGDGAGAYPTSHKPQVIWIGLRGDLYRLNQLYLAVGAFLKNFGLSPDEQEFKPHITLGRTRQALQSPETNKVIALMRSEAVQQQLTELEAPMRITTVQLCRSYLETGGARHEIIATSKLGS
jgi:RNA 2',3'-cyclic 3'-phosphodiesterase